MNKFVVIASLFSIFIGCQSETKPQAETKTEKKSDSAEVFPELKNVKSYKNTDFTPTFESSFDKTKNIIYSTTLPLAWNEIRSQLTPPIGNFQSAQLKQLDETKSFLNTLKKNEYETTVEVIDSIIKASAYFRKSLPFEFPLTKHKESFKFGNIDVQSFGFYVGNGYHGQMDFSKVNYFNDENDYSISLFPKDKQHEIILILLNENTISSFDKYFDHYKKNSNVKINPDNSWKYKYRKEDDVKIPIIEFNLEKDYEDMIESKFTTGKMPFEIVKAYQQNAFVLNEKGAEVESFADMAADAAAEDAEKPAPKLMYFNKPFVLFLKRKDAEFPYFGIYIFNDELLKKF